MANVLGIRGFSGGKFDCGDANTPYVCTCVIPTLLDHLRRHPKRRANERVSGGSPANPLVKGTGTQATGVMQYQPFGDGLRELPCYTKIR